MEHIQPMKGLIRHLLDNAADHDVLIKILWDTLDVERDLDTIPSTMVRPPGFLGSSGPLLVPPGSSF